MSKALSRLFLAGGAVVGAGILVVAATAAYTHRLADTRSFTVRSVPARPVALVLGAEIYPDGTPSPFLQGRLDKAVELYRAGKVKVVLVSGDNRAEHYNEPDGMRAYLIGQGIPADRVVADYAGFDTYDSCVRARRIFGVDRLTVVTQGYHLPRALTTCQLVGVDAVGVGDYTVQPYSQTWRYGTIRELPANLKMLWDVVTRRTPVLGAPETAVTRALGG